MQLSVLAPPAVAAPASDRAARRAVATERSRVRWTESPSTRRSRGRWVRTIGFVAALLVVVIATGWATGLNLAGAPHYESDEGTYVSSAWSMFEEGKLSYYTYNYDHPPLGWLVIGAWARLLGSFTALGSSVVTGRALMVVVAAGSAVLILGIVQRATRSLSAGVFAALLFAISPLATALHRQVWLDNLATFWLLASVYLVLGARPSLKATLVSAIAFGLSFWTKEVMIVLLPGMLVLVGVTAHRAHRNFALTMWALMAVATISVFVLLAFLKDELLPPGVLWSSTVPHVSLVETYVWQMSRGGGGSLLSVTSDFRRLFTQWWTTDPVLIIGGIADAVLAIALFRVVPVAGAIGLLALTFLMFLARGGVVLYYYIIPVLALLAVLVGLLQGYALRLAVNVWRPLGAVLSALILVLAFMRSGAATEASASLFSSKPTAAQDAATAWMINTLPTDSIIVMDSYPWVEMRDPSFTSGQPFIYANYYWPGVSDPSVRDDVLHNDWRSIDYISLSPSLEADMAGRGLPLVPDAIAHADEVQAFSADDWSVRILRVRKVLQEPATSDRFLTRAWTTYKAQYIHAGQVVNPQTGLTTSEGQAYALLQAVYADDRQTFDQLWSWTRNNLQVRPSDALLAWAWGPQGDTPGSVIDANPAADADQDAALALLFASRRWNEPAYQSAAVRIVSDIWDHETTRVAGQPVVVAGPWATGQSSVDLPDPIVNPSYFAPYAYRIFADVDQAHPWRDVVDASYTVLSRIQTAPEFGGSAGLVPNWIAMDATTGQLKPADVLGDKWSTFGYDASRLPWRLALDWLWFRDNRAKDAAAAISLPNRELSSGQKLVAAYDINGQPAADYEVTSMYATSLAGLLIGQDRTLAERVFAEKIMHAYRVDGSGAYWGDLNDFNDQNWSWFATALMDGGMGNLWAGETVVKWEEALP